MTILTREQLDQQYEAWRLYDVEHIGSYDTLGEMLGVSHSTAYKLVKAYRLAKLTPEERKRYQHEARSRGHAARKEREEQACARCGILRSMARIDGSDNPNADTICDMCHEELSRGEVHTNGDLSTKRMVEMGYVHVAVYAQSIA